MIQTLHARKPRRRILAVEDHEALWPVIRQACREEEWDFHFFPTAESALDGVREGVETLDAALLDIRLPGMDGLEFLRTLHALDLSLPVLMFTAQLDPDSVVACMRAGAHDYITKPFRNEDLLNRLRRAVETRRLGRRGALCESEEYLATLMGPSEAVSRLASLVAQVSPTEMSVLIEGESGTGKELVARRIHALSLRTRGPFIAVDCGAIPEALLESELFGFKKGSFTGASSDRAGKFQAAHGGTIFLDEIENLPIHMQSKLLRVLQQREVTPIGADLPNAVDVRIITASNCSLKNRVEKGEFRLDLYHRIAEFPVHIPPLRERIEDLTYLARRFLREACVEFGKRIGGFGEEVWPQILSHPWPGNARELQSVIRRATLLNQDRIERVFLDPSPARPSPCASALSVGENTLVHATAVIRRTALREGRLSFKSIMRQLGAEMERCILIHVLEYAGGNKSLAARILDLDYKTLHEKVKEYGIQVERNVRHEKAETV